MKQKSAKIEGISCSLLGEKAEVKRETLLVLNFRGCLGSPPYPIQGQGLAYLTPRCVHKLQQRLYGAWDCLDPIHAQASTFSMHLNRK
jgi:hypothetical protein